MAKVLDTTWTEVSVTPTDGGWPITVRMTQDWYEAGIKTTIASELTLSEVDVVPTAIATLVADIAELANP